MLLDNSNIATIRLLMAQAPRHLSEIAVNWFKDSFKQGGFTDQSFQPWEPRKNERSRFDSEGNRIKYKAKDKESRGVLIKTGNLRRSIQPLYSQSEVGAISYLPYSGIHNEGGQAGRNGSARIPRRMFMGDSAQLMNKLENDLLNSLDQAFTK